MARRATEAAALCGVMKPGRNIVWMRACKNHVDDARRTTPYMALLFLSYARNKRFAQTGISLSSPVRSMSFQAPERNLRAKTKAKYPTMQSITAMCPPPSTELPAGGTLVMIGSSERHHEFLVRFPCR